MAGALMVWAATAWGQANGFAIVGATIVDGAGSPPYVGTVVVRGERIVSAGPGTEAPAGVSVVDGRGHTVTPGFFDLHTHLPYSAVAGLTGDWPKILKAYLYCGVTTVVDFGTYPEMIEPMRRLLREGTVTGPRIHFAARITTPGGHGAEGGRGDFFTLEVTTPAEARAAARQWLAYKPDAIKVFTDGWRYGTAPDMTSMDEGTLAVIVKEAHAAGVEVLTHTVTLERAKMAGRAGVDVIAHGIGNAAVDSELAGILRASGTTYAPTLAVYERKAGPYAQLLRQLLEPAAWRILDRAPRTAPSSAARQARWGHLMTSVQALRGAGVRIATGTDAGVTGTFHGWSTLREIELLAAGGLTPREALEAATGASAKAIGVAEGRGTIASGKVADLVLIEGAPHENIHDVERVRRVWLGGKEVDRGKLARGIAAETMSPIPARRAAALIDDIEGERTSVGTYRVSATDEDQDHSKILFGRTLRAPGNHALSAQARLAAKSRPWVQVVFPLSVGAVEPVDASAYRGLQFDTRGDGEYRVVFQRRGARVWRQFPEARFEAGGAWATVRVALPEARADLLALAFEISGKPGGFGWLELDNLRFY